MISIRRCQRCHRYFDAYGESHKTICPLCEYGDSFLGEFDDDAVYSPDIRAPSEEPYTQDLKTKRRLWKLCESDIRMQTNNFADDEDDSDNPLNDDFVIDAEQNVKPFIPLLYQDGDFIIGNDVDNECAAQLSENVLSRSVNAKPNHISSTPPRFTLKKRADPYSGA